MRYTTQADNLSVPIVDEGAVDGHPRGIMATKKADPPDRTIAALERIVQDGRGVEVDGAVARRRRHDH